ncbi:BgtTE-56017 [Blumeria graminis f. sp. tritici]|uniref:BgtTE-56017 n=1 Tax=Blumeria graminis f. sp. tritici TaxID=62690 RepID=A0A9X9LB99_BLUGR|nr:BgtTE-56017 [Blumeria graminis f. sp. tritici]
MGFLFCFSFVCLGFYERMMWAARSRIDLDYPCHTLWVLG